MTRLALACLILASPAVASDCASAKRIFGAAQSEYGEKPVASGEVNEDGTRLVLLLNPESGTFTAVTLSPDGTACLIAGGTDWKAVVKGDPA